MAQLNRYEIILKIQELSFACVDLNLYLDTHPDDANAVNMYNSFSKQLNEAIRNYECKYGPLTNFGYGKSGCPWHQGLRPPPLTSVLVRVDWVPWRWLAR